MIVNLHGNSSGVFRLITYFKKHAGKSITLIKVMLIYQRLISVSSLH